MDLNEYMSVRRAYNLVRQDQPSSVRLTFEEYAILCHLANIDGELKTSQIADYQGVLRPTTTHRTNHLSSLSLIDRHEGLEDRRNVCCSVSEKGRAEVARLSKALVSKIDPGQPLHRSTPERICMVVDAMGEVFCTAGDLVLLGLSRDPDAGKSISELVEMLGLLQPTVSMSVAALVEDELVSRGVNDGSTRMVRMGLTPAGNEAAEAMRERIEGLLVHRRSRSAVSAAR
jgi:DNA-binding MarR family transcriptional regulator